MNNLLSTITGGLEICARTQNIPFEDLFLMNKRLYSISNKLLMHKIP